MGTEDEPARSLIDNRDHSEVDANQFFDLDESQLEDVFQLQGGVELAAQFVEYLKLRLCPRAISDFPLQHFVGLCELRGPFLNPYFCLLMCLFDSPLCALALGDLCLQDFVGPP